jgi:hypothetical protein
MMSMRSMRPMRSTRRCRRCGLPERPGSMGHRHSHHRGSYRHSFRGGGHAAIGLPGVAVMPQWPNGHSQFQSNQILGSGYATGGPVGINTSALANPPPVQPLPAAVDNLAHSAMNQYGNYGAGSGFPSRGWF